MIHPSYVELMKVVNQDAEVGVEPVVNSRYSIVIATAKRARQLINARKAINLDETTVSHLDTRKPLSTAVEELYTGQIHIMPEEEDEAEEVAQG